MRHECPLRTSKFENEPFDTFYCEPTFAMAPKTLEILNNGLEFFLKTIKTRKEAWTLRLSRRESISLADKSRFFFFAFFKVRFWSPSHDTYSLITHTLGYPPRGMSYEGVDCTKLLNIKFLSPCPDKVGSKTRPHENLGQNERYLGNLLRDHQRQGSTSNDQ